MAIEKKFILSPWWWFVFVIGGISFLCVLAFSSILSPFQQGIIRGILIGVLLIHIFESVYALILAKKYQLPILAWTLHTFICGVVALYLMKKIIKVGSL
jgi:hypothetical protein